MENLHRFHLQLCRYAAQNAGQHLDDAQISAAAARINPRLSNYVRALTADSWETSPIDEQLLNQDELKDLADLFDLIPFYAPAWSPLVGVHKKGISCMRDVRKEIAGNVAQQWAADCQRFRSQLEQRSLDLATGIRAVAQWTREICRLLEAGDRFDLLPRPKGEQATPTCPRVELKSLSPKSRAFLEGERNITYIEKMRKAIAEKGAVASATELRKAAAVNRSMCRKALRVLEEMGEYRGFQKSKSDKAH